MARQAERLLAIDELVINALNVFPVPDGDTGSNMLATVREALAHAEGAASSSDAAERLARGAMLGARGNSGVILSQLFRAQHEALASHQDSAPLTPAELAAVLSRAAGLAAQAIGKPVDGTILTVLQAAARVPLPPRWERLGEGPSGSDETRRYLAGVLSAAELSLAKTPEQLPILREAGVVDSGGYGLLALLRGWYEALVGEPAPNPSAGLLGLERARQQAAAGEAHPASLLAGPSQVGYGCCVTLLVDAPSADESAVQAQLQTLGDSVLVAAVDGQLKLHIHVPEPEAVLRLARGLGQVVRSDISDIDEQVGVPAAPIVAVAPGDGLARVFRGLGAAVVAGGQTQNPSTAELLAACQGREGAVFLLPNNGNVLAAARQAASVREGILVVPARSVPAGVAATLAYDPAETPEHNLARMAGAAEGVGSAEIVRAARAATLNGISVEPGRMMVLLEGELLGVEDAGLAALAARMAESEVELLTIYYGAEASEAEAAKLADRFPDVQVEIVRGDQPHAAFILGFE